MIKEKKIRKLSGESFETKFRHAKEKYNEKKKEIIDKYKKEIFKANNLKEKNLLRKKRNFELKKQRNKYALKYNAINDHKLYRRSILETKITDAKNKYKASKYKEDFNQKVAKKELAQKIKRINKTYSKPISTQLRIERNINTPNDIGFIDVPLMTPTKKWIRSILLLFLAAFITTISLDIFIKPFGVYNAGLRGITQMIYYVIKNFNPNASTSLSYILFFGLNIPFAIFGWFKIGKKFTILTIIFIAMQYLISMALDYSGIEDLIKPFGKTQKEISIITNSTSNIDEFYKYGLPFISAMIGAILYGSGVGIIYSAGGSTGGSKFFVTWISSKKQKSIGYFAMIISIFVITTGIIVNKVIINGDNVISSFTSVTLFSSVVFVFTSNWTLDKIFAKSKKQKIEIVTSKKEQIIRFLDIQLMFNRSFEINEIKAGFGAKKRTQMSFIVSQQESKLLEKLFIRIDKNAFISSTKVDSVSSKFYNMWFE